jgi:hypothetical protein
VGFPRLQAREDVKYGGDPEWVMEERDSPYVYRDDPAPDPDRDPDPEGRDVVIVDGEAMSYRVYRGVTGR